MIIIMYHNRNLNDIRGVTRETLSGLLVYIESREWSRNYNRENDIPPEHLLWSYTTPQPMEPNHAVISISLKYNQDVPRQYLNSL